jgi:hypothetical protein
LQHIFGWYFPFRVAQLRDARERRKLSTRTKRERDGPNCRQNWHRRETGRPQAQPCLSEPRAEDTAIFGQLTWNFRPDESDVAFEADPENKDHGTLVIREGIATLPDSVHRHYAITRAVESVASGSSFHPDRRFSLRIWRVPVEFKNMIFYAMNMEHDKADSTRSKWLAQKNIGQMIARDIVRRCPHLGEGNVETVTNTLSIKNPRLAAFNTIASGFEEASLSRTLRKP